MISSRPFLISATLSVGCGLWLFAGNLLAGPLEDYLANPPKFEKSPWRKGSEPETVIPKYLKQFEGAKADKQKAIAISELVSMAGRMSYYAEAEDAAAELMDQHVVPNMDVTKRVDPAFSYAWRILMLDCADFYKRLGKLESEQRCLESYVEGVELAGDRGRGLERLARNLAAQKEYANAIRILDLIGDDVTLRDKKKFLLKEWTQKLEEQ